MIAKDYVPDIAIIGGGPCGLSLAGILEQNGFDYVVYERGSRDEVPRGGCLDLHTGSGQRACKLAGCYDLMRKYGRLGDATEAFIWDHHGNKLDSWGKGRDAPELDRWQIKDALLSVIPPEKIRWDTELREGTKDEAGKITLHFTDGTEASGFKLIVGADGVRSKIRPLVTDAEPEYSGEGFITGHISPGNPYYAKSQSMTGVSPQAVFGNNSFSWNQMQASKRYRIDMGFRRPGEFSFKGLNLDDEAAVKKFLLTDPSLPFHRHGQWFKDMINAMEGPFRLWPLWYMPTDRLNWEPNPGVTLVGDAAHVTAPYVGDGVNCGMRDTIILVDKLKEFGITTEAIGAYEKEMFGFAKDMIERSKLSGSYMLHDDSPKALIEGLEAYYKETGNLLIGCTDDY